MVNESPWDRCNRGNQSEMCLKLQSCNTLLHRRYFFFCPNLLHTSQVFFLCVKILLGIGRSKWLNNILRCCSSKHFSAWSPWGLYLGQNFPLPLPHPILRPLWWGTETHHLGPGCSTEINIMKSGVILCTRLRPNSHPKCFLRACGPILVLSITSQKPSTCIFTKRPNR